MRKLKIEAIDSDNNTMFKVIAVRVDATGILTVVSTSESHKEKDCIRLVSDIDHWNIIDGLVTIYYTNGNILEITRYND